MSEEWNALNSRINRLERASEARDAFLSSLAEAILRPGVQLHARRMAAGDFLASLRPSAGESPPST